MILNAIIRYRLAMVKPIQLTAYTHVKNVEELGKGAPDMQTLI